jgi:cation diffusion facilitator family transporter
MTIASAPPLTIDQTAALTRRVTGLSLGVSSVLSLLKAVAWVASGSVAMLASLADSGLDLLAALATFFAVRYAVVPPDREHRYGHGKAEAFASLVQAGLVFASAALVGREAVAHIIRPTPVVNSGWDLGVMAISMGLTCALLVAQSRVLRKANSVAVTGDRAHYAADLGSNVIAVIGIAAAALTGGPLPDALAGLGVVVWLIWGAISVFRSASTELMDRELADDSRRRIIALMTADPAVRDVHQLRTRASGPYVHIQMHADLDPSLTLVQAHHVMVAAEKRVLEAFPAADIIIHPDPRGQAEPHGGAFPEVYVAEPPAEARTR